MSDTPIRWGICGCGGIAGNFATALSQTDSGVLSAVAARDATRAQAFADEHGAERAHGNYQALIDDDGIDALYIATVHTAHQPLVLKALAAGKPVLCEKPMSVNEALTASCIAAAREHNAFLMEGMWTRCQPIYRHVRRWLAEGRIGDLHMMRGDFCIHTPYDPYHRHYDPAQAGGALLDLGIYPLAMALWLFPEEPVNITSSHSLAPTGVDDTSTTVLRYHRGRQAVFSISTRAFGSHDLDLIGSKGRIHVPSAWWASSAQLRVGWEVVEDRDCGDGRHGFVHEIDHVRDCLRDHRIESPLVPWADSLRAARMMDLLRSRWGVVYPQDGMSV